MTSVKHDPADGAPVLNTTMTELKRVFVGLRLLPDSVAAADETATAEGTDRSTVLRRWMGLGRAAEAAGWDPAAPARRPADPHRPAPRPTSAHGPVEVTARQARSMSKREQVTRRDR